MAITAEMVKQLRDRTGVGMSKCKEALEQAKGNMDEAIDILRKAGIASAVKKEGRETKEGAIIFFESADAIGIAEVNAETDFVVKNDKFQAFAQMVAKEVALKKPQSLEEFMQSKSSRDSSLSIDQERSLVIQTIGENIQISRIAVLKKKQNHSIGTYSHSGGKILTAVELSAPNEQALARDIAMHTAAASPEYLNPESVPAATVAHEREIARGQVQGKPAHIMEKILDGKIQAFFDAACLSRQKFVKDDSKTIQQLVDEAGKKAGHSTQLVSFIRWMVGQR